MAISPPLRVAIDARLIGPFYSGVGAAIIGLASGLSALEDGNEEYNFLTYANAQSWIEPYLSGPSRILSGAPIPQGSFLKQRVRQAFPLIQRFWLQARLYKNHGQIPIPQSDGTIERSKIDVMHFIMQSAFLTQVPSLYVPQDLQHVHYPEFHSKFARLSREIQYSAFCKQAHTVISPTSWGKRDLEDHFSLPKDKVQVVPYGPMLTTQPKPSDSDLREVREKYGLPERFIFFPAVTWPHKNHIGLLNALAILRREGHVVPLVASGQLNEFYPTIKRYIFQLQLQDQVQFLGFVSPFELQCLYILCRSMVFPSKFEGWGLPVTEAFSAEAPVACSNVTSLPAIAGDAALLFDPNSPEQMAEAINSLWVDDNLRRTLIQRGNARGNLFSWERTARLYRAHYRHITDRNFNDEDQALLNAPSIV